MSRWPSFGLASIVERLHEVLLLDVRMPAKDAELPVILVPGHATQGEIKQSRQPGV